MPTRTDTLVIGAGAAGLFCALRWAGRGSVTLVEAGPAAGNPRTDDHNAPGALGYGVWTTNRRDGGRWGTWAGVVPAARQAGVRIRPDTAAGRLVFDGTRCTGADVAGPDGPERITADRVIVCAGAYGSPALLMRSGIGPEPALARLGAEPVSVLPG